MRTNLMTSDTKVAELLLESAGLTSDEVEYALESDRPNDSVHLKDGAIMVRQLLGAVEVVIHHNKL